MTDQQDIYNKYGVLFRYAIKKMTQRFPHVNLVL
jgi:hypothetical protein